MAWPDDSVGLVLARTARPPGSSSRRTARRPPAARGGADSGWLTFDQWLADQVALQTGDPAPRLVELEDDGTVARRAPGVEVLDQQADPDLPAYGTGGGPLGLALVTWQGERWFVLSCASPARTASPRSRPRRPDGAETLDDFIAFAADRADEGGMR